jgi:hypothetical protein
MNASAPSKEKQLDELMQEIYGCSFRDALRYAFDGGLVEGYRLGKIDGRRKAKGLKIKSKPRGKPPLVSEGLASFMTYKVDDRAKGITIEQAVAEFLKIMSLGHRERKRMDPSSAPIELPKQNAAVGIYFRTKRKLKTAFPPMHPDDELRAYIHNFRRRHPAPTPPRTPKPPSSGKG